MLSSRELASLARGRLRDAQILLDKNRLDGATYLCGYAVEIALKARIVKTLRWPGFPSTPGEFDRLTSFRTHNLETLVHLSGWEAKIKSKFQNQWVTLSQWTPESRYDPPGTVTRAVAEAMIESARTIVGALL